MDTLSLTSATIRHESAISPPDRMTDGISSATNKVYDKIQ